MRKFLIALMALSMLMCTLFAGEVDYYTPDPSKTGNLVVYTTAAQAEQDTIIWNGFCKKYPNIKVDVVEGGSGVLVTRVASEKANPQGDIVAGLNYPQSLGADGKLWYSYVVPTNKKLPKSMQDDTKGKLHYSCTQFVCLIVNDDELKKLGVTVNGYEDLLNPKLKGHIISADPASSSSAWNQLSTMLSVMGDRVCDEKAWDYVDKFAENLGGVMSGSSSRCYKDVINGEYAVGVTYEAGVLDYLATGKYPNCRMIFPKEGITEIKFASAIINGCRNLDNAKLYIDYIMSDKCQKDLSATSQRQANPNFPSTFPAMSNSSDVFVKDRDEQYFGRHKKEILARWTKIWAKHGSK